MSVELPHRERVVFLYVSEKAVHLRAMGHIRGVAFY